jgi:ketosteroid isomerase-like protein
MMEFASSPSTAVTPSGRTADNPWVLVVTTRDGKIARFRAYEDTAASRDAFLAG